jgi:hypothetical protein
MEGFSCASIAVVFLHGVGILGKQKKGCSEALAWEDFI